jgi:hypothetical protein
MEAVNTLESSVNFFQTTQDNIHEDSYLRACHHENFKPLILNGTAEASQSNV